MEIVDWPRLVFLGYGRPGFVVVPANRNEKHVLPTLIVRLIVAGFRVKTLIADPQYSSSLIRCFLSILKITPVIPYPANQMRHVKGLLRVDKLFRVHGPKRQVKLYHKRSANERSNAWLKDFYGLDQLRTRGLENATIHVTLCARHDELAEEVSSCCTGQYPNSSTSRWDLVGSGVCNREVRTPRDNSRSGKWTIYSEQGSMRASPGRK